MQNSELAPSAFAVLLVQDPLVVLVNLAAIALHDVYQDVPVALD